MLQNNKKLPKIVQFPNVYALFTYFYALFKYTYLN